MPFVPDTPKVGRFVPDSAPGPAAEPAAAAPSAGNSHPVIEAAKGALDLLYHHATSALAQIPAGIGYGGAAVAQALGANVNPADVQSKVSGALTQPLMTNAGVGAEKVATDAIAPVVAPVARAADSAATAVGKVSPTGEALLREAPHAAQAALGVLPVVGAAGSAVKAAGEAVVDGATGAAKGTPVERLRAAGYKLRPDDAQATQPGVSTPGTTVGKMFAPKGAKDDFTLQNQQLTTKLAGEEIGKKDATSLVAKDFNDAITPHVATYQEVGKAAGRFVPSEDYSGDLRAIIKQPGLEPTTRSKIARQVLQYDTAQMTGPDAVKTISALRRRAAKQAQSDDVLTNDMGHANRAIADAMESEIGRQIQAGPQPELLDKFNQARTSLAKIHNVESATKAGQVDAAQLLKARNRGAPLSGNLNVIADAAEHAPAVTRHSLKTATSDAGGNVQHVLPSVVHKPLDLVGKGIAAVGRRIPGVRGITDITSDAYQNRLGRVATPTEASYTPGYGRPSAPVGPARGVQQPGVDFEPTAGVVPSKAQTLAGDLGLAPEPVANPQRLPEAPSRLVAETPPAVRGDINFRQSPHVAEGLAGELGLEQPRRISGDSIEWSPPSMANQMVGNQRIDKGTLSDQLGLRGVERKQTPRLQLTPGKSEIEHVVDESGQHTVRDSAGGEIIAKSLPEQGKLQIISSHVPQEARGQGRSVALAERLAQEASKHGFTLTSDMRVSEPAQRMYAALEKRGYTVTQNPATRNAQGELVSKSELKPVFEVSPPAKE